MALIFSVYEPHDRVRATGWWAMMGAAAPAAGLIAGGRWSTCSAGASSSSCRRSSPWWRWRWPAWCCARRSARRRASTSPAATALAVGVAGLMFALGRSRDVGLELAGIWAPSRRRRHRAGASCASSGASTAPLLPLGLFSPPQLHRRHGGRHLHGRGLHGRLHHRADRAAADLPLLDHGHGGHHADAHADADRVVAARWPLGTASASASPPASAPPSSPCRWWWSPMARHRLARLPLLGLVLQGLGNGIGGRR